MLSSLFLLCCCCSCSCCCCCCCCRFSVQALGFKVIIVLGDHRGELQRRLSEEPDIDRQRLLCVGGHVNDGFAVIRVAEEYNCAYALPDDDGAASCFEMEDGMPWTLPRRLREWAEHSAKSLEVRYGFEKDRGLLPRLPSAVRQYLAGGGNNNNNNNNNNNDNNDNDNDNNDNNNSSLSAAAASAADLPWPGGYACLLTVPRGCRKERLVCVRCQESSGSLWQAAAGLALGALQVQGGDTLQEVDGDDPAISEALKARSDGWATESFMLVTVTAGRHAGLRGIGVGSNKLKKKRAACLALAASAALQSKTASEDALPEELMELVKYLQLLP
ncbi:unnamed protein product [Polarella glacialis]|uniref:Uncharacterized protein n=1 Tax=Polarella glacialis TaxID=89957 RepID=A0A813L6G8_POLGL|nr:unnamed protein product [Polarella glacialis]